MCLRAEIKSIIKSYSILISPYSESSFIDKNISKNNSQLSRRLITHFQKHFYQQKRTQNIGYSCRTYSIHIANLQEDFIYIFFHQLISFILCLKILREDKKVNIYLLINIYLLVNIYLFAHYFRRYFIVYVKLCQVNV